MPVVHGLDATNYYNVPSVYSMTVDPTEADNYTAAIVPVTSGSTLRPTPCLNASAARATKT